MAPPRRPARRASFDMRDAMEQVLNEHRMFMSSNAAQEDADWANIAAGRHPAARAAISHLEAIMKLEGEMTPPSRDQHGAALAHARAALAADTSENSSHDHEAPE